MRVVAILNNKRPYPLGWADPDSQLDGYGGAGRFWEGLAYGFLQLEGKVDLFIIGPRGSRSRFYVKNVVAIDGPIGCKHSDYLGRVYKKLKEIKPDFVIFQNPTLVDQRIAQEFSHVCRVAGYRYGTWFKKGVNYLGNSASTNAYYKKNWPVIFQTCFPDEVLFSAKKESYWLYMSNLTRAFREKGLEYACKFATEHKMKMLVAGPVGEDKTALERMKVLQSKFVRWIGPITQETKAAMLAGARGVFYPIAPTCVEMGSTFAIESAFSGTPFIARSVGCFPEYVANKISGYLCKTHEEFEQAVHDVSHKKIGPSACNTWAVKTFDQAKIARQYIELIRNLQCQK